MTALPPLKRRSRRAGFTLAEVLAAMFFLAIVIPVVAQGMALANRAGVMAERSREAAQLADRVLTEMTVTGDWQLGEQEGDFEPDYPGYRWELTVDAWPLDVMNELTVKVTFQVQGEDSSISLSTLVSEEGL